MGENNRLARHRRKRFEATGIQQIVVALLLLAAVTTMGFVMWQTGAFFHQLEAGLPQAR